MQSIKNSNSNAHIKFTKIRKDLDNLKLHLNFEVIITSN